MDVIQELKRKGYERLKGSYYTVDFAKADDDGAYFIRYYRDTKEITHRRLSSKLEPKSASSDRELMELMLELMKLIENGGL